MNLPSDLIDLLAEFADAKVEYLLIGGQALALHGRPRFTKDTDLWLRDTPQNIENTIRALEHFGAPQSTIKGLQEAKGLDVVWMGHPPARIDLMKAVPGGNFNEAWAHKVQAKIQDVDVHLVNRALLRTLKLASGRPQDLVDAEMLETEP